MNTSLMIRKQQGAATLLTSVVLLICITLIALLTTKTVLVETQITADNYRISQASAAASAAMDRGVAYFIANGFDADKNNVVDYIDNDVEPSANSCTQPNTTINTTAFNFPNAATGQNTLSQFYFDNTDDPGNLNDNLCSATTPNMKRGYIIAKGWSDDCMAVRTISQCVGTVDFFKNGLGPEQSWVSKAGIGAGGGGDMINRYTNTNVWTGGTWGGPSAAHGTYIRPSHKEKADYTTAQLDDPSATNNTQIVSTNKSGIGLDVITGDAWLASLTASTAAADMNSTANNQFFDMYFSETKQGIKDMAQAAGQLITNGSIPSTVNGLVWVEGDYNLSSDFGTSTAPVILIVDGNLTIHQSNFFGVLYVTGNVTGSGTGSNNQIHGSIVAEKTGGSNSMSANTTVVYKPWGGGGNDQTPFMKGTGTIIAGTWQDWTNW